MDEEYYNWIHSPDFTEADAKDEGYIAYTKGLSSHDNPFNDNDELELHLAWEEGHSNAAWEY